jgi:hypothetical protein
MTWGRLYEMWIGYPVDKSYPMDKSPIQWIAICRTKMRCTKHGLSVGNLNFNRRKPDFPEISYLTSAVFFIIIIF